MKTRFLPALVVLLLACVFILSCGMSSPSVKNEKDTSITDRTTDGITDGKGRITKNEEGESKRDKDIGGDKGDIMSEIEESFSEKTEESTRGISETRTTGATISGLKAGFADDNKQFNYFVNFLSDFASTPHYPLDISERIVIKIKDSDSKPVANARVKIYTGGNLVSEALSYADGTVLFFPKEAGTQGPFNAEVTYKQSKASLIFDRIGKRQIDVDLQSKRPSLKNIPLDMLFILDTTGSMGEEIERLKTTIGIINSNLSSLTIKPSVRFGMVLYKDAGDEEYVTKVVQLTGKLEDFEAELDKVEADGGGDIPEDLQSALDDAVNKIQWASEGIRLSFIVTDAPPHLDYDQAYTYAHAARDARKKGIKIFSVGTGGLDITGEYILRQVSQYTYAKYIFLTYGEAGESAGGVMGSVSHHTGANFQTDKLEAIIIRFAKEELGHLSDQPIEEGEEYFEAIKLKDEDKKTTLTKLFDMALSQLIDYSSLGIEKGTPASLIPIIPQDQALSLDAEYFTDTFNVSLAQNKTFVMVERKDLQKILDEMELQLSGLVNDESAVKIGAFLGAKMLITGKLYKNKNNYEIFIKLLNVKTAEVLSVTKTMIDSNLGLSSK